MTKRFLLILLLLSLMVNLHSQDNKAFRLFEEGRYEDVITHYQAKHLEKEDVVLLTRALLQTGNNERALEISRLLFDEQPNLPSALLNYYQALTFDNQISTAYDLVEENKSILSSSARDSLTYDIEKFMIWQYDVKDLVVTPLNNLNTDESEYSPVPYQNRLYYCVLNISGVNDHEKYDIKEGVISKENKREISRKSPFSLNGLKSSKHTNLGPFCVFEKTIYYTVSTKNFKGHNNLKIIKATIDDNGKITDEQELEVCKKSFSAAHPTISEDGKKLFFSSDMPGGFGGMDLYVSYLTVSGWGVPINLGNWVNTVGNEVFPHYHNNKIYFSSDGLDSYGGLDIYSVDDDYTLENVINLKYPINTPFDDFGISLIDENSGYFSSNRPTSKKGDNLYSFKLRKIETESAKITGIMKQEGIPIANAEVQLLDMDGNVLETTMTDANGNFVFNRQPDPGRYGIKLANTTDNSKHISLSLTDEVGNVISELQVNSKGVFVFEMFALDEVDELSLFTLNDTDPYMLDLRGIVYRDVPGDVKAIYNIEIQDKDYLELAYVKTDENALFIAEDLPYDARYIIQVETGEQNLKVAIVDQDNNIIQELFTPGNNLFAYQHIGDPTELTSILDNNQSTEIVMKNESIKISNIYYGYDSAKLNAEAKKSLSKLAETLKNNKRLTIELISHTDSRGTLRSNEDLSQRRAQSARKYLIRKGVKSNRIIAKGFGWSEPLIDCFNHECTEEDHAKNRRTEFRIISN